MTAEFDAAALYKYVQNELARARQMVRYAAGSSRADQEAFRHYWQGQVDAWLEMRALLPKPEKKGVS